MPPRKVGGREASTSRVREDPEESATSSDSLIDSSDSLLRQVEEYAEGSASAPQSGDLVISAEVEEDPEVEPVGMRAYRRAPSDDAAELAAEVNPSRITPSAALKAFREARIDVHHFYPVVPTPSDRAHNPPPGHMTVYTRSLSLGQTVPFHPFVKALCNLYKISPAQLSPNCWAIINSMVILWRKYLRSDLSVEEFLYCYSLRASPRQRGFFYLGANTRAKPPVPAIVVEKTTSCHGWKPQFFFLGGNFNRHPLDLGRHSGTQAIFSKYCEEVDRPKLSTAKLERVEHILSLDESLRSTAVLNTAQNRLLYGLSVILQPPVEPVVPPESLLSAVPADMKYNIPPKPRKKGGSAGSRSTSQPETSADPTPGGLEAQSRGVFVLTPGTKRPRTEEPIDLTLAEESSRQPRRRDKGKEVASLTEGPLQMPGSKTDDPRFQVTDIADRHLSSALRLPDRFRLPIQAIYSYFNPESWEKFTKMDLLDRHRVAVIRQVSALEATLLNYVEIAALLEKGMPSRAAQEEILSLGILRDELQSSLDLEKTKVKSLEEAIAREKRDSFKEGCSKGVENFLASDAFQQKRKEAVEEFLRSEEYRRSVDSLIASFRASQDFKDAVAEDVEKFKSSAAFEDLVSQRLEDYQDSAEFEELQLNLMKAAGEQILDRFRKKRPDVDLAFLDDSDSEEVVPLESTPVVEGAAEQMATDGAEQVPDAAVVEPEAEEEQTPMGEAAP